MDLINSKCARVNPIDDDENHITMVVLLLVKWMPFPKYVLKDMLLLGGQIADFPAAMVEK